jgi:hypothetical protein
LNSTNFSSSREEKERKKKFCCEVVACRLFIFHLSDALFPLKKKQDTRKDMTKHRQNYCEHCVVNSKDYLQA